MAQAAKRPIVSFYGNESNAEDRTLKAALEKQGWSFAYSDRTEVALVVKSDHHMYKRALVGYENAVYVYIWPRTEPLPSSRGGDTRYVYRDGVLPLVQELMNKLRPSTPARAAAPSSPSPAVASSPPSASAPAHAAAPIALLYGDEDRAEDKELQAALEKQGWSLALYPGGKVDLVVKSDHYNRPVAVSDSAVFVGICRRTERLPASSPNDHYVYRDGVLPLTQELMNKLRPSAPARAAAPSSPLPAVSSPPPSASAPAHAAAPIALFLDDERKAEDKELKAALEKQGWSFDYRDEKDVRLVVQSEHYKQHHLPHPFFPNAVRVYICPRDKQLPPSSDTYHNVYRDGVLPLTQELMNKLRPSAPARAAAPSSPSPAVSSPPPSASAPTHAVAIAQFWGDESKPDDQELQAALEKQGWSFSYSDGEKVKLIVTSDHYGGPIAVSDSAVYVYICPRTERLHKSAAVNEHHVYRDGVLPLTQELMNKLRPSAAARASALSSPSAAAPAPAPAKAPAKATVDLFGADDGFLRSKPAAKPAPPKDPLADIFGADPLIPSAKFAAAASKPAAASPAPATAQAPAKAADPLSAAGLHFLTPKPAAASPAPAPSASRTSMGTSGTPQGLFSDALDFLNKPVPARAAAAAVPSPTPALRAYAVLYGDMSKAEDKELKAALEKQGWSFPGHKEVHLIVDIYTEHNTRNFPRPLNSIHLSVRPRTESRLPASSASKRYVYRDNVLAVTQELLNQLRALAPASATASSPSPAAPPLSSSLTPAPREGAHQASQRERELEEKLHKLEEEKRALEAAKAVAGITDIRFDELECIEEIGSGGFGVVWMGKWKRLGNEKVAIKRLHAHNLSEDALEQFKKEIVMMHVTELCKRGSLYSVLHSKTAFTQELLNRLALESARGLLLLHQSNIVHRDIKSPNVLVTEDWHAKLGDFGLAKARTETKTTTKSTGATSLRWTAPEMFKFGAKYTSACDVFSFGVLLYEIATREIPYGDADDTSVREGVKSGDRMPIPETVPKPLAELIARCWQQEAAKRPSMLEVVAALEPLVPDGQIAISPKTGPGLQTMLRDVLEGQQRIEAAVHPARAAAIPGFDASVDS